MAAVEIDQKDRMAKTDGPAITENRLALSCKDYSFCYPGSSTGFGPLSWQVQEGSFTLLVGATGSGKTTLLRCLKPALAPVGSTTGSVNLFGREPGQLSDFDSAQLVGYVAQSPDNQLICDTVWHELAFGLENLGTPQDLMRRRVAEVAHFFGIEPWFHRAVVDLSGGQKQMVTLASVLALRPRLLLLDEPTSQLDPIAEKSFLHALFRVNRELGLTVVVATHAPEAMADYATQAVRLGQDGLLEEVPLDALAARPLGNAELASSLPASGRADDAGARASTAAVALHDAYVRYGRTEPWVLSGFDLRVGHGQVHALVGGNGCGKSTALKAIAGVASVQRGTLRNALVARQALLPQDPKALFACDTVEEELREWQQACGYDDRAVNDMLQRFGLGQRRQAHPYDLSGGQQQMLALAKVLLTNPDLLLLDEPSKGLDAELKCLAATTLLRCAQAGATVVLATHDLPFALAVAGQATMLFDGQVACSQSTPQLFADNLFYRPQADAFYRAWQKGKGCAASTAATKDLAVQDADAPAVRGRAGDGAADDGQPAPDAPAEGEAPCQLDASLQGHAPQGPSL